MKHLKSLIFGVFLAIGVFGVRSGAAPGYLELTEISTATNGKSVLLADLKIWPSDEKHQIFLKAYLDEVEVEIDQISKSKFVTVTDELSVGTHFWEVQVFSQDRHRASQEAALISSLRKENETLTWDRLLAVSQPEKDLIDLRISANTAEINLATERLENGRELLSTQLLSFNVFEPEALFDVKSELPLIQIHADTVYAYDRANIHVFLPSILVGRDGPLELWFSGKATNGEYELPLKGRRVGDLRYLFTSDTIDVDHIGEFLFETQLYVRSKKQADGLRDAIRESALRKRELIETRARAGDSIERSIVQGQIERLDLVMVALGKQIDLLLEPLGDIATHTFSVIEYPWTLNHERRK